jgi:Arc/MetJ-type ribon-helix-helix transcriptional regulator
MVFCITLSKKERTTTSLDLPPEVIENIEEVVKQNPNRYIDVPDFIRQSCRANIAEVRSGAISVKIEPGLSKEVEEIVAAHPNLFESVPAFVNQATRQLIYQLTRER